MQNNPNPQQPRQPMNPYGHGAARPPKNVISNIRHQEALKIIPGKYGRSWGAMVIRPNITFANQDEGERVYVLIRSHWITNLGWIIRNLLYILIPLFLFLSLTAWNITISFISVKAYVLILMIYYSVIMSNIIRLFTDWYFDPKIVTNIRVLEYEFTPFASYSISELNLENIEDIKERSGGLIAELFNFGTLEIVTANSTTKLIFRDIPNPTKIRDIITDLTNIAKTYRMD